MHYVSIEKVAGFLWGEASHRQEWQGYGAEQPFNNSKNLRG